MKCLRHLALCLALTGASLAAETLPPKPAHYFNDYANVVNSATAEKLNARLEEFERTTSCQVVVAVFPKMQSNSSLDDFSQRIFQSWKPGQKDKNNGVVFLVFLQEHAMRIQTGYGLEGALPDALCKRIVADEVAPCFKRGDYAAGLSAGVEAILKATRGEYKGTGKSKGSTVANKDPLTFVLDHLPLIIFFVVVLFGILRSAMQPRGRVYRRGGGTYWGGSGGGGWSSGGGGDFSGGGGSSGGGGASGSW